MIQKRYNLLQLMTAILLMAGLLVQSCSKKVSDGGPVNQEPVETDILKLVPDSMFRVYLKATICPNAFDKTGKLIDITNPEVANFSGTITIDTFTCPRPFATSLRGIEYFSKMKKLIVQDSPVDSLRLTATMAIDTLRILKAKDMQYVSLSGCTSMRYLRVSDIPAVSLNLSGLPVLNYVNLISLQRLSTLKTGNDPQLQHLMTYGLSSLKTIDVSGNAALRRLYLENATALTNLDITKNQKLKHLQLTYSGINTIDLSKNDSLATVRFDDSNIDTVDFSHNPALYAIIMFRTKIRNLNLLANPKVCALWLDGCSFLKTLDLRAQKNFDFYFVPVVDYNGMSEDDRNQKYQESLFSPVLTTQHRILSNATRAGVNGATENLYGGLRVPQFLDASALALTQIKLNDAIKDNYSLVMARRVLPSMTPVLVTVYGNDQSTILCNDYDPTLFKCN